MSLNSQPGGIAYVLRKFPVLSETFILNEILALEKLGVPIHIFSLERPNDPRYHERLSKLKAHITYLPHPSCLHRLAKHSTRTLRYVGANYFKALGYALKYPHRPTLLLRFLQGCYIANHLHKLNVTHIHSHFANRPTTAALFTSLLTGIPFSFTAHAVDIFKNTMNQQSLAKKIRSAKFVIAVSDYNKRFLEDLSKVDGEKIVRLYNGINLDSFVAPATTPAKPERFTLLCISRLVEKKGIPVLVEACKHLRDREIPFDCAIVGTGRLQKALEEQIETAGLQGHVKLHGACDHGEVIRQCHSSHLFVLPCIAAADGNRDGLPVSITEALASGLPVITTSTTGIPEVVRDGHNGLMVPENDAHALAAAIESVICRPDLYSALCANTRSSVETTFDINRTSETLKNLFVKAPL